MGALVSTLDEASLAVRGSACQDAGPERQVAQSFTPTGSELLELIADGIVSTDERGRIILINKAAEALFGYSRTEVLGRAPGLASDAVERPLVRRSLDQAEVEAMGTSHESQLQTLGAIIHAGRPPGACRRPSHSRPAATAWAKFRLGAVAAETVPGGALSRSRIHWRDRHPR